MATSGGLWFKASQSEYKNLKEALPSMEREKPKPRMFDMFGPTVVKVDSKGSDDQSSETSEPGFKHWGPGDHFSGASVPSACYNLTTAIVGASIMSLPAAMRLLGLPLGLLSLVAVGILTQISLEMLIKTTMSQHVWTYSDLVGQVHGSRARFGLDASVFLLNFSLCIVYLIIVGDVLSGGYSATDAYHDGLLVQANGGVQTWWNSRYFVVFITTLVVIFPLTLLRHVDSLHYTSALSMALALLFVVFSFVICIIRGTQGQLRAPALLPNFSSLNSIMSISAAIPVIATAFICHFSLHPIFSELKDKTEATMTKITRICLSFASGMYLVASISGYLMFGKDTAMDVLVNFDQSWDPYFAPAVNTIIRISYTVHIIFVFPVVFYPLRTISDDILFPRASLSLIEDSRRFFALTVIEIIVIYVLAVAVPNIWIAYNLVGSTATMLVGMVFPATVALKDKTGVIQRWEKIAAHIMLLLSAFVAVTSIVSSIYFLATGQIEGSQ